MSMTQLKHIMAAILLTATTVFAAEPVGTIVSLKGKATAVEQNGTVRNLEIKSPVFLNDTIKTESESSLQMMFLDESILCLGEKSEMTIDEYVYNPDKKEDNACTLHLGMGVFRAVTAKITALHPERFKVKTRLTTIGIRGCEVVFTITERGENIYVIGLPEGKSIEITLNAGTDMSAFTSAGIISRDNAISIIQAGIMVRIEEDGGATHRLITPQEAIDLIEEISLPSDNNPNGLPPNGFLDAPNQNNNLGALDEEKKSEELLLTPTPTSDNESQTEDNSPTFTYVTKGTGNGWEWGIWQDSSQIPDKVDFLVQPPFEKLTDANVLTLIAMYSSIGYNLSASGEAAAVVKNGGNNYLLNGECGVSFNIAMGGGTTWSTETQFSGSPASISDGQGHDLYFFISGTVDGSGVLQGSFASYILNAGGTFNLGSIQSSTITANLIGSDSGTPEGLLGHFNVIHISGPTVQGGFAGSTGGAF